MKLTVEGRDYEVEVEDDAVTLDGKRYPITIRGDGRTQFVTVAGQAIRVDLGEVAQNGDRTANVAGKIYPVKVGQSARASTPAPRPAGPAAAKAAGGARSAAGKGAVKAQMAGRVLRINVAPGDAVKSGDPLLVLEAMKMENEIRAPRDGTIVGVSVSVGDRVSAGDALVSFAEE